MIFPFNLHTPGLPLAMLVHLTFTLPLLHLSELTIYNLSPEFRCKYDANMMQFLYIIKAKNERNEENTT